jgi:hypothetical protein
MGHQFLVYAKPAKGEEALCTHACMLENSLPVSTLKYTDESFSRGNDFSWDDDVDDEEDW